jgi:catechol 2,3-dioxygenase-like lactoylglutathione lyase family enzyme
MRNQKRKRVVRRRRTRTETGRKLMFARINHVAMVSSEYAMLGKFYEVLFGMKSSPNTRPQSAVTVGDGYVGLNFNPRRPGRPGGLDHFGIQVEDVETVFGRMEKKYPKVKWLKRPGNRPFAGISTHDPDGNMFDLSQKDMANRAEIYTEADWQQDRTISHYAVRTMNPEACAEFYCDVFDLQPANRAEGDDNHYVTDGRMTVVLMPWDVTKFAGTGIARPGPDHIAFKVESMDAFKQDMQAMIERNQNLAPPGVGIGPEGKARLDLQLASAPYAQAFISDYDNVMVAISE